MNISSPLPHDSSDEPTPPLASPPPSAEPKSLLDWENLIGGKWALWAGSLCIFLAFASFLAYTWRYIPPPPPWAKVAMGLGAGAVLLGAGEWFRSSTQKWFSEGLSGAGLSLCYLSLWAAAGFFHIIAPSVAFGGMAFLTALGVALAVRAQAPALSLLSTIGGFLTPVLLQSGQSGVSQGLALLSYVAVLNMGIVAVSLFQRWRGLTWLSFVGTLLLVGGWAIDAPIAAMRGPLFLFLCLYFVLFLGASCFYSLARQEETAPEDLILLFSVSSLFAPAGYALLLPVLGHFPGAFALGLALFWGLVGAAVRIMAPRNHSLRYCLGGLSLLAATIVLPMQWKGPWLAIGWAGEAGLLLWLSQRLGSPLFLRAGQCVWGLAFLGVLSVMDSKMASDRLMVWSAFLAVSAGAAFLSRRANSEQLTDTLEPIYSAVCVCGGAWLLSRETYGWFEGVTPAAQRPLYSALFLAPIEAVFGLTVFALGLRTRYQLLRLLGLGIVAISAPALLMVGVSTPLPASLPFWNARPAAIVVVALVLGVVGWLIKFYKEELPSDESQTLQGWPVVVAAFVLGAVSLEMYFGFAQGRRLSDIQSTNYSFALAILWCGYGAALLTYVATARHVALRVFAWGIGTLGIAAALLASMTEQSVSFPLFNWRFAAFGAAMVALFVGASRAELDEIDGSTFTFLALMLGFWLATQETYEACRYFAQELGPKWQIIARMLVSLAWSVYGAGMLVGGIAWRAQNVRLVALGLLCLTVVKIFLFDLAFLSGPWRTISLGGLGVTLIFISWLYSRFGSEKIQQGS